MIIIKYRMRVYHSGSVDSSLGCHIVTQFRVGKMKFPG